MSFPSTALDIRVQVALDAPDLSDPSSWVWTDATAYVLIDQGINITIGRRDGLSQMSPSTMSLTVDNSDGRWTRSNPTGTWYGRLSRNTPIRAQVNNGSGYVSRFTGHIDAYPPRWDYTGRYAVAQITASGALRRMGLLGTARSSAFRTNVNSYFGVGTLVGYWPCEDGRGATSIASGIGGSPSPIIGDIDLAADSSVSGSDPLPKLTATGAIQPIIPPYTADNWTSRFMFRMPTEPAGTTVIMAWNCVNPVPFTHWRLMLTPGTPATLQLQALNAAGTNILGAGTINFFDFETYTETFGRQIYVEVHVEQNGADIDIDVTVTGTGPQGTSVGWTGTYVGGTVSRIAQMYTVAQAGTDGMTVGHLAFSIDDVFLGFAGLSVDGYPGEGAYARWQRFAAEMRLPWWAEVPDNNTFMGAQPTDSVIGQIREIGDAEGVPIYDTLDGLLKLPARSGRYNAPVALSLSFTASQLQPPQPTDDDRYVRNDVTASRRGGSSARRTQTSGPNSTVYGVYEAGQTLNIEKDTDLPVRADWLLHLGTVDELRYPQIDVNLASRGMTTAKINDWLACTPGSRLQLTSPNLPGLAPDTVDQIIEGWQETLRYPREWTASLACSPYAPWTVWELEDDDLGRLDTSGSYLLGGVSSSATSLVVATSSGPTWSTTAEPYHWHIAGEKIRVDSMAAVAPTFVAAGAAAHGTNTAVSPGLPAGAQQGDLLVVYAAIRSVFGVVEAPTGYEPLFADGHVAAFTKIHSGSESAPTVTFTGGGGSDPTSAQMAAIRGVSRTRLFLGSQSNASAQNIAYPSMTYAGGPLVALWFGWKEDDWTSVANFETEIGEPSTAIGNDQGLVWNYSYQSLTTGLSSGSWTVTGGAAAISSAYVVALDASVQTATVTRAVNGVSKAQSANAAVTLWRPGVGGLAL